MARRWPSPPQARSPPPRLFRPRLPQPARPHRSWTVWSWADAVPATGFRQTQPDEGEPASERTEVRVIFTERTLYVEVVYYDRDAGAITVSGSRRDSSLDDGDSIQIILDTFRDKQSGFVFGTSPAGQQYDGQVVNAGEGRLGRSTTSRAAPAPGSTGTRISLFFPEKRPFFLENAGVFSLSSVRQVAGGNPAQTELFFSRRIGIGPHGREIPILAGARMSGKVSDSVSIGVLNMQTDAMGGVALANNFTVHRGTCVSGPAEQLAGWCAVRQPPGDERAGRGRRLQPHLRRRWTVGHRTERAGLAR